MPLKTYFLNLLQKRSQLFPFSATNLYFYLSTFLSLFIYIKFLLQQKIQTPLKLQPTKTKPLSLSLRQIFRPKKFHSMNFPIHLQYMLS